MIADAFSADPCLSGQVNGPSERATTTAFGIRPGVLLSTLVSFSAPGLFSPCMVDDVVSNTAVAAPQSSSQSKAEVSGHPGDRYRLFVGVPGRAGERAVVSAELCRARFLRELGQLRERLPDDEVVIGSYESVVDSDDEVVFGLLIGLVGPAAPACADVLWERVSGFLRDLRRLELFSEPIQWRSPVRGRYSRYTPPLNRPIVRL